MLQTGGVGWRSGLRGRVVARVGERNARVHQRTGQFPVSVRFAKTRAEEGTAAGRNVQHQPMGALRMLEAQAKGQPVGTGLAGGGQLGRFGSGRDKRCGKRPVKRGVECRAKRRRRVAGSEWRARKSTRGEVLGREAIDQGLRCPRAARLAPDGIADNEQLHGRSGLARTVADQAKAERDRSFVVRQRDFDLAAQRTVRARGLSCEGERTALERGAGAGGRQRPFDLRPFGRPRVAEHVGDECGFERFAGTVDEMRTFDDDSQRIARRAMDRQLQRRPLRGESFAAGQIRKQALEPLPGAGVARRLQREGQVGRRRSDD